MRDPLAAAAKGDAASLRALAREGVGLDDADEDGFTPAMLAARGGRAEAINALVAAGANLEAQCKARPHYIRHTENAGWSSPRAAAVGRCY